MSQHQKTWTERSHASRLRNLIELNATVENVEEVESASKKRKKKTKTKKRSRKGKGSKSSPKKKKRRVSTPPQDEQSEDEGAADLEFGEYED